VSCNCVDLSIFDLVINSQFVRIADDCLRKYEENSHKRHLKSAPSFWLCSSFIHTRERRLTKGKLAHKSTVGVLLSPKIWSRNSTPTETHKIMLCSASPWTTLVISLSPQPFLKMATVKSHQQHLYIPLQQHLYLRLHLRLQHSQTRQIPLQDHLYITPPSHSQPYIGHKI